MFGHRVVQHREVPQAEEVHLDQPERLARRVVELGDDRAVLLAAHDRDDVDQRLGRHDHAGRVHPPLPLQTLQVAGGVHHRLDVRVGLVQRPELSALAVAVVLRSNSLASGTSLPITGAGMALVIRSPTPNG